MSSDGNRESNLDPTAKPQPQVTPSSYLGINKRLGTQWDAQSSHKMQFVGKDSSYGHPPEGSLSEQRARKASKHINNEMVILVSIIRGIGDQDETNPEVYRVTFGKLFNFYTAISDKVVGILLRARRWNLVEFEGEMLYQGQDDGAVITLLVGSDIVPTMRQYRNLRTPDVKRPSLKQRLLNINSNA